MSESTNAKTKRTARRRDETFSTVIANSKESLAREGDNTGIQGHIADDQGAGVWGDRHQSIQPTNSAIGKILERLDNLDKRFSSYVKSHQERLDLRKQESVTAEAEFKQESEQLRQEILALMQHESELESQEKL